MNGRSNFPSPRFSGGTPRNDQSYKRNQPYYLQPNCPYLSPRGGGNNISSPRHSSSNSPDFIPLGISSPVGRPQIRGQWNQRNYSNNSSFSGMSTPPSSDSSPNFSPYRRNNFRGRFRDKKHFNPNYSGSSNSSHISLYVDKEALEDPWAELESKQKRGQFSTTPSPMPSQETVSSTVDLDSEEEEEDAESGQEEGDNSFS